MFHRMEQHPSEAPEGVLVRTLEFAAVHSILARSSIEDVAKQSGWSGRDRVGHWLREGRREGDDQGVPYADVRSASSIATESQSAEQRVTLEDEFEVCTACRWE